MSSRRARGVRDSRSRNHAAVSAAMPMGRLTRKIRRQRSVSVWLPISRPPTSGPAMVASPITAPKLPKAAARSRGGKATWITESTCGYISAAISPCTTREITSMSALRAKPHAAEASTNPAIPVMNRRLRPKMSPSRPPVISTTA